MDDNDLKILEGVKGCLGSFPLIIDVGANRGSYTDFALKLFPTARIILIEPNDLWIGELKMKYANNTNIKVIHTLVGKEVGKENFYYFTNRNDQISSIYKRPVFADLPMMEAVKDCTTIDEILSNTWRAVDFIKVDTEGAEFDVLKGSFLSLKAKQIKFIQIEYGGTYPDAGITMKEVIEFVNSVGYRAYSFNGTFAELDSKTFVEDFHYDNYLISKIEL